MTHPFDLTGRVALVTGSSRGIGYELAAGLAEAGAHVVLNGVDRERLARAATALAGRCGREVRTAAFDVSAEAEVEAAVARVESEVGPIRILINNAGIQYRTPLLDLPLDRWEQVLRVNLTSAFVVGRAVARSMVARATGKVINICSLQSELARPSIGAYTAAKGGLRNLTRAMAAEWAGAGVQVNGIAPGYIQTDMTHSLVNDPAFNSWVLGRVPAHRWGRPGDLTGAAVFLASDASDYVNGQVITVDGGMSVVV